MSTEAITGKFDQLKGKVKQSFGEATGDATLANAGVADQVKGHAEEAWGSTKDAAQSISTDARASAESDHEGARLRGEDAAHNLRNHIVNAAQAVKDSVVTHTDNVRKDH